LALFSAGWQKKAVFPGENSFYFARERELLLAFTF
jgi:hypothetical protein